MEKIPLLVLSGLSCVATIVAQGGPGGEMEPFPVTWQISNALVSYLVYIWQMFCPLHLAAFYPHPENSLPVWEIILALVLLVALSGAAIALRRKYPYFLTGWLWYLGMLVPVIGILQIGMQGHADRYTYLPQIGLYLVDDVGNCRSVNFMALSARGARIQRRPRPDCSRLACEVASSVLA